MKKVLIALAVVLIYAVVAWSQGLWPFVPAEVDTSGWKTYTDSARGLSFKYPADWTVKAGDDLGGYTISLSYTKDNVVYTGMSFVIEPLSARELAENGKPYASLDAFVRAPRFTDLRTVMIGESTAYIVSSRNQALGTTSVMGYLEHNKLIYEFPYQNDTMRAVAGTLQFSK